MNSASFAHLLYRLCVELGFCLPPDVRNALIATPPIDARRATDAVFRADGMDPDLADRQLFRQVRMLISEAYYNEARPAKLDSSALPVVTIILDTEYGHRLESLDRSTIWIVASPTNEAVAHEIWRRGSSRDITTFHVMPALSAWEALAQVLPDVEDHHGVVSQDPPCHRLEVIGCWPNDAAVRALGDIGFELEQPTAEGFFARRSSMPSDSGRQ